MFAASILAVGTTTISNSSNLSLMKRHPRLHAIVIFLSLLNLGPIFFILLNFLLRVPSLRKLYSSQGKLLEDLRATEIALSATKLKQAVCENLPMLIIVCCKTALGSRVNFLEIFSGASSSFLLSKTIIDYAADRRGKPMKSLFKLLASLILGNYLLLQSTLLLQRFISIGIMNQMELYCLFLEL